MILWAGLGSGDRIDIGSREVVSRWHAAPMDHAEVLLIGGRAGVGKTTVGWEVSALLRSEAVAHAIIDGDFMGQVHPAPEGDPHRAEITESNLTAVWANFVQRGYRRLIYTNTVSVLPEATGMFERAMGAGVGILRVLLTASDATARERLVGRDLAQSWSRSWKEVSARRGSWTSGPPRRPCEWRRTDGLSLTSRGR